MRQEVVETLNSRMESGSPKFDIFLRILTNSEAFMSPYHRCTGYGISELNERQCLVIAISLLMMQLLVNAR